MGWPEEKRKRKNMQLRESGAEQDW